VKRWLAGRGQAIALGIAFPLVLVVLWHLLVVSTGTQLVPTPYQVGRMMVDFSVGGVYDDAFSGRQHTTFCRVYNRDGFVNPNKPGYNYGS